MSYSTIVTLIILWLVGILIYRDYINKHDKI